MGHTRKQLISLLVTARCNMRCVYCYVPRLGRIDDEDQVIDVEFAAAGIRDFFNTNPSRMIRYFGAGEPTSAFPVMEEIYNYAGRLAGKELRAELQTNGFFNDHVGDWVEKNIDVLWISCDGPPEVHDAQRPGVNGFKTNAFVARNIERFSKVDRMQAGVRATVAEDWFDRQEDLVEYFHGLGVKYLCAAPTYRSTANPDVKQLELIDFAKGFVKGYQRAQELGMFYQTHLIVNFDEECETYCRAMTPCPHLTSDGYVSCCDWALLGERYLPGPLQQLIYGKWDKEKKEIVYDQDAIKRIQARTTEKLAEGACRGCDIVSNCAGGCVAKTMVISNDIYAPSGEWCQATKYLHAHLPEYKGLFPCLHS